MKRAWRIGLPVKNLIAVLTSANGNGKMGSVLQILLRKGVMDLPVDNNTITVKRAAEILGLTERRVRQLCDEKELGCFKLGGIWLIDRVSVEEHKALMDNLRRFKAGD